MNNNNYHKKLKSLLESAEVKLRLLNELKKSKKNCEDDEKVKTPKKEYGSNNQAIKKEKPSAKVKESAVVGGTTTKFSGSNYFMSKYALPTIKRAGLHVENINHIDDHEITEISVSGDPHKINQISKKLKNISGNDQDFHGTVRESLKNSIKETSDKAKKNYRSSAGNDIKKAASTKDKSQVSKRLKGISSSLATKKEKNTKV